MAVHAPAPEIEISIEDQLEWEDYKGDIPFWKHAVAGSCAGVAEHVMMFPLDTAKTRLQALSNVPDAQRTFSNALRTAYAERGFFGLFRGAAAITSGCIPAHASLFGVYEVMKVATGLEDDGHHPIKAGVCGAVATLTHDAILTPLDVVKQRLQLGCYNSSMDCIKTVIREEGAFALFRSMPTTVVMNLPFGFIMAAVNETLKESFGIRTAEKDDTIALPSGDCGCKPVSSTSSPYSTLPLYFFCAGVAGGVASALTTPFDVVKTRLQTQDVAQTLSKSCCNPANATCQQGISAVAGAAAQVQSTVTGTVHHRKPKYSGFFQTAKSIFQEEGVRGLYRGSMARVGLAAPSTAICWGTYESVKYLLGVKAFGMDANKA